MTLLHADNFKQSRKVRVSAPVVKFNRRALVALVLAFGAWAVPLAPALALFLAWSALAAARNAPKKNLSLRGSKLALPALAAALLGLALQGVVAYRGVALHQQIRQGPAQAITQGLEGDLQSFMAAFSAATGSADQAQHFLGEVEGRYGTLVHATPTQSIDWVSVLRGQSLTQSYRLQFSGGIVSAKVAVVPPAGLGLAGPAEARFASLVIRDPQQGSIDYPQTQVSAVHR